MGANSDGEGGSPCLFVRSIRPQVMRAERFFYVFLKYDVALHRNIANPASRERFLTTNNVSDAELLVG